MKRKILKKQFQKLIKKKKILKLNLKIMKKLKKQK